MILNFFSKKKQGKDKVLNELIAEIDMNSENNYKDAAQAAYKKFCLTLSEHLEQGILDEVQGQIYLEKKDAYDKQMAGYTHKDQKCTW